MLPHVVPTTDTLQPASAAQAGVGADGGASRPALTTALLASLRAEVLLRLLETMLRQMPRNPEAGAQRNLLESLLAALKAVSDRDTTAPGKRPDPLAKVPPEIRPIVEKLIGTVLSSLPTRSLAEIVRNPTGPETQKLLPLLMKMLPAAGADDDAPSPRQTGLTPQQIAAVSLRDSVPAARTDSGFAGDARALQVALARIFEPGDGVPRTGLAGSDPDGAETPARSGERQVPAAGIARERAGETASRIIAQEISAGPRASQEAAPLRTAAQVESNATIRASSAAETPDQPSSADRLELARAVLREAPIETVIKAIVRLLSTLSEGEAQILRAILTRPLDETADPVKAAPGNTLSPATETEEETAPMRTPSEAGARTAAAAQQDQTDATRRAVTAPIPAATGEDQDGIEARPAPRMAAEVAASALPADARLLAALSTGIAREAVPPAFVPYPAGMDEADQADAEEARKEERAEDGTDDPPGEGDTPADENDEPDGGDDREPESPDMAHRREKTADMVGTPASGTAFYQKLGEYWT